MLSLVRARRVLSRRHGTVYITFADPISLRDALGDRKDVFRRHHDAETLERKRRFVQKLGFRLLREVNDAAVAGATSMSASVLLGLPHRACRLDDFVIRARSLVRYLRTRGVRFTASLERNDEGGFRENLTFLESGGLVQRLASENRSVINVPDDKRLALADLARCLGMFVNRRNDPAQAAADAKRDDLSNVTLEQQLVVAFAQLAADKVDLRDLLDRAIAAGEVKLAPDARPLRDHPTLAGEIARCAGAAAVLPQ